MTWPVVLFVVLQIAVAGYWIVLTAQVVSRLVLRIWHRRGRQSPAPVTFLASMADWVRDPGESGARRALAGSTALLATLFLISTYA